MQAEQELAHTGMSQDEMIARFKQLDTLIREAAIERRELGNALASLVAPERGGRNTMRVTSTKGEILKIEFRSKTEYTLEGMITVKDLLGDDLFNDLFKTKIDFTKQVRNLNRFMGTVHPDERLETAKELIRGAMTDVEQSPSVSVEKERKQYETN